MRSFPEAVYRSDCGRLLSNGIGFFFVLERSPGLLQLATAVESFHPLIVLNRVLDEGSKSSDSTREILKANFRKSTYVDFGIDDLPSEEHMFFTVRENPRVHVFAFHLFLNPLSIIIREWGIDAFRLGKRYRRTL